MVEEVQIEKTTDGFKILDASGNREIIFLNKLADVKKFLREEYGYKKEDIKKVV